MKRLITIFVLCILLLTGCENNSSLIDSPAPENNETPTVNLPENTKPTNISVSSDSDDVVEIKEKMYIAQINDILLNSKDYLGKTIKYEGIFKSSYWKEGDRSYNYVIRYGPGCCGSDGEVGFEVSWDGEWPHVNDWCEAVGTLEEYEMNGWSYFRLSLTSLTVLDERGEEFVYQ